MNKKILAAVIAAVMTVPAMAAASQFTATGSEQIVEGHTVFTVLEKENVDPAAKRQGWDIAGLVREVDEIQNPAGPNVAWFNDQWKTFYPGADEIIYRYPCGGYVIGTLDGIDPLHILKGATITLDGVQANLTYKESYYITDPNGFVSVTHLYALIGPLRVIPVWITEVQGINSAGDDDGVSNCDPQQDLATHDLTPDGCGFYHDCEDDSPVRLYNFDMFGLWRDVSPSGLKQHGNASTSELANDGTGCEEGTEWDCDTATLGDDGEGYSHPYNPQYGYSGEQHEHETGRIGLLFASTLEQVPVLAGAYPPAYPNYVVYDDEALESEVDPCNNAGYVNVDIAASCFPS